MAKIIPPRYANCGSADIYEMKWPPPFKSGTYLHCGNCYRSWTARKVLYPGRPKGDRRADREKS